MIERHPLNPLIRPRDISPSRPDFDVIGTFNAGAVRFGMETLLLVRVAERPVNQDARRIFYTHLDLDGITTIRSVALDDRQWDTHDARLIQNRQTDETILTSRSHLRLARSTDGVHFSIADQPWLAATPPYENFGVEDARITAIDGVYYINYSAVSPNGIATGLISTRDFEHIERHGIIFPPANRDVVLFPEKIGGQYICYHRPMPAILGSLNIWMAASPDLQHWGEYQIVLSGQSDGWEDGRVGGGAPPMRTSEGWLSIYHAADRHDRYCLGAFLTPLDQPGKVIARTREPILWPEAPYETQGFFPNVVFTCGAILKDDLVQIYYGASDETVALAEIPLADLLSTLRG